MKRLATVILISMAAGGALGATVRMGQLSTDTTVETLGEAPAEVQLVSKARIDSLVEALSIGSDGTWLELNGSTGLIYQVVREAGVVGAKDMLIMTGASEDYAGHGVPPVGSFFTPYTSYPSEEYDMYLVSSSSTSSYLPYMLYIYKTGLTVIMTFQNIPSFMFGVDSEEPMSAPFTLAASGEASHGSCTIDWYGIKTNVYQIALVDDIPDVGGFVSAHAATNIAAAAIEDILSVTNALLVVSNEVATIETNGVPVWSSASGGGSVPPSVTNELWQSIAALQGTVASLQGTVAALSHAWGEYAPDGSPNPDPDYMLWINRPATVWGAGFQWAVSGGHAVLTATGMVAFAAGGSGEMRIGPGDGTNYFGFVQGGSVEVGASASGITVADDVATIVYPYETGDFPTLWFTADLSAPFETMDGVVWVDNADGTATVTAPATTARGFWRATTSSTFASEFQSTMPARFTGGVWGAPNVAPVKYDSTITIESGGKSYRIVAEEVH